MDVTWALRSLHYTGIDAPVGAAGWMIDWMDGDTQLTDGIKMLCYVLYDIGWKKISIWVFPTMVGFSPHFTPPSHDHF